MSTKVFYRIVNGLQFRFTSDIANGKILDTKVELIDKDPLLICWISGDNIDAFTVDLSNVILKYRI
jgi:hypothetical protein